MSKSRYVLKPGVNRVSIGSIIVDGRGYSTNDPGEVELLEANADVKRAPKQAAQPAAKPASPPPAEPATEAEETT